MTQQTHVHSRQIAMRHDRIVTWDCHEIAPNVQLITVPIVVETVSETLQHSQDLQRDRYQKSTKAALAASTAEAAIALCQVGLLSWQKAHMKSGFLAPI